MGVDYYTCNTCGATRHSDYVHWCLGCDEHVCEDCDARLAPTAYKRLHVTETKQEYDARVMADLKAGKSPRTRPAKVKPLDLTKPNMCVGDCGEIITPEAANDALDETGEWMCSTCFEEEQNEDIQEAYCPKCTDHPPEDVNVTDEQLIAFLCKKAGTSEIDAKGACRLQLVVDEFEKKKSRDAQKKAAAAKAAKPAAAASSSDAATGSKRKR